MLKKFLFLFSIFVLVFSLSSLSFATKGDIDNDGEITLVDIRLLLQVIVTSDSSTQWDTDDLELMDFDNSGKIDIIDLRGLIELYNAPLSITDAVTVGDFIKYTPTTASYTLRSIYSGASNDVTTTTNTNASWRVWKIDSTGVYIVPTTTLNYSYGSSNLTFGHLLGFVNGPTLINDICKTLYTNTDLGVTSGDVRSLTIEDLEAVSTYNKNSYVQSGIRYGQRLSYELDDPWIDNPFYESLPLGSSPVTSPTTRLPNSFDCIQTAYRFNNIGPKTNLIENSKFSNLRYEAFFDGEPAFLASSCIDIYVGDDDDEDDYGAEYPQGGIFYTDRYTYNTTANALAIINYSLYSTADDVTYSFTGGIKPIVRLSPSLVIDKFDDSQTGVVGKPWKPMLP